MKKWFLILMAVLLLFAIACKAPENASAQTPQSDAATTAPQSDPADPSPQGDQAPANADQEPSEPDPTRPPAPEEPEYEPLPDEYKTLTERSIGDWYADVAGMTVTLTLSEDGTYALSVAGGEAMTGKWEEKDGVLVMDGDEENPLLPTGGVIRMDSLKLFFTRELPEVFQPGAPIADVKEGSFDGYWKSCYTAVGEGTIRSEAIGEDTEIYVEGMKLATNGSLLPLAQYDCTIENGVLTFASEQGQVTLQLLEGGFLRLSLDNEIPGVIYLARMPVPDQAAAENP